MALAIFELASIGVARAQATDAAAPVAAQPAAEATAPAAEGLGEIVVTATNPNLGNILYQVYTVYTPENAASAFVDYALPVGGNGITVKLHLDANYASSQYSFQNEAVKADASFVMNGRLAVADVPVGTNGTKVTLSVWCRNLLDTTYIYRRSAANDAVLGDYGNFNPPRTFGVEGSMKF